MSNDFMCVPVDMATAIYDGLDKNDLVTSYDKLKELDPVFYPVSSFKSMKVEYKTQDNLLIDMYLHNLLVQVPSVNIDNNNNRAIFVAILYDEINDMLYFITTSLHHSQAINLNKFKWNGSFVNCHGDKCRKSFGFESGVYCESCNGSKENMDQNIIISSMNPDITYSLDELAKAYLGYIYYDNDENDYAKFASTFTITNIIPSMKREQAINNLIKKGTSVHQQIETLKKQLLEYEQLLGPIIGHNINWNNNLIFPIVKEQKSTEPLGQDEKSNK
jgi:hypothetical protein